MAKENYKEQQKMATRGDFEPISQDFLNKKFITTLGDMIKLMNCHKMSEEKSMKICNTLAKVIDNQELKREYLKGFMLGLHNGKDSKLPPLKMQYITIIKKLHKENKINDFEYRKIEILLDNFINAVIDYMTKENSIVIAW